MKQQQFPALSSPDEDLTVSFTRRELRAMRDAQIEVLNVSSLLGPFRRRVALMFRLNGILNR
jgi:hypothetical protein